MKKRLYILFALIIMIICSGESPLFFTSSTNINKLPACDDDNNAYNGYCWRTYWIPGLVSHASILTPMPTLTTGKAVYYDPGLMESTAESRGLYNYKTNKYTTDGSDQGYIGGVATETCSEIGTGVWLRRPGYAWEGPYLVVDCAQRNDAYGQMVYWGLVTEVDFNTALRWNMVTADAHQTPDSVRVLIQGGIDDVEVSKMNPDCIGFAKPINISEWFLETATFTLPKNDRILVYYSPSTWLLDGIKVTFYQRECPLLVPKPFWY